MASISKRSVGGKPRYDVNYREPGGAGRRKSFHRKADAEAFAAQVEADKARGVYRDPRAGRITFKEYAETWLSVQTFDRSSRDIAERSLRLHIYPVLGRKPLAAIEPSTIQGWLKGLQGSSTYRRMILSTVSSILASAVDDDRIPRNPCAAKSVRVPPDERPKVVPWPVEWVSAMESELPSRYRVLVALAAGLGLRQGEAFGLAVEDVDFLRGQVTVCRQVRLHRDGQTFAPTKSRKERTIPLPATVRDAIAAHLAAYPAQPARLPWREADAKLQGHNLVVTTPEGAALHRNHFNREVWGPARAAAGIEAARANGMHALRHYYASVLLDAGENIKAVSEYLGHADAGFTLRTYTHLMPSSTERTKSAIDAALGSYISGTSATG